MGIYKKIVSGKYMSLSYLLKVDSYITQMYLMSDSSGTGVYLIGMKYIGRIGTTVTALTVSYIKECTVWWSTAGYVIRAADNRNFS